MFAKVGAEDKLKELCADDREAAEFFALAPRKRVKAARRMIAENNAAKQSRSPEDVERIRGLEAEVKDLTSDLEQSRKVAPHPGSEARQAVDRLRDIEAGLAETAEVLIGRLPTTSGLTQSEALNLLDSIRTHADAIEAAALVAVEDA